MDVCDVRFILGGLSGSQEHHYATVNRDSICRGKKILRDSSERCAEGA